MMPFTTYSRSKITSIKGSYGCPRWFDAVYNSDVDYIKKHFKNINKRDELGYSALHHASIAGLRDVVEVLIEGGEDVDGKGQDGATPLRCAVQEGHAQVVEILLSKGASLLDKDEDELTVLHSAAGEGHYAIVSSILSKARWLANEQSRSGWSPMHSAAVMGHAQVVGLLLDFGANAKLKNNQGKTAGDLAKERNKLEVSRRIEQVELSSEVSTSATNSRPTLKAGRPDEDFKSEEVRAILECPVCLEVMLMCKIYQCKFGHNVCERCCLNPLLSICPQCREPYRNIRVRNLGLEELARVQQNL
eukprot:TRINITY_DN29401_c0_g1_i1.p1 TRINITY_DN29401_c0_g1~~TRINITY_DN29401_c0_g1_i1.p1  ORF type:complete len:304 (-),score=62.30 TRINITY_DN29401_c0_g1_i1:139-1050(-)